MENFNIKNDEQLVNWMEDNLDDAFLNLKPLLPEMIFSASSSNDDTQKCVLDTHGVEGFNSPTLCFSFPDGMETRNNKSNLVSFETSSSSIFGLLSEKSNENNNKYPADNLGSNKNGVCIGTRSSPIQAPDHVGAEKKRREKMGQLFISLSKIVPGLKKLDKASLIGDAIEHMKELKERVNVLEEEATKNNSIRTSSPSNALVVESSSDEKSTRLMNLDIKARVSKNNVLINICCKKQKSIVSKIQHHLGLLHLAIMDMRIMPFGDSLVDITILALMRDELCLKPEDVVEHLKSL